MRILLILIFATASFTAGASAQENPRSPDEFPQRRHLEGARKNKNNQRRGQSQQRFNPRMIFMRLDENRDQILSSDEIPERMQQRFARADADQNGEITMKELSTAMNNMRKRQRPGQVGRDLMQDGKGNVTGGGRMQKGKGKGFDRNMIPAAPELMARMDKNFDQVLSEDEVPMRMRKKFSELDKNGDQRLDEKELVSAVEHLKAMQQNKGSRYSTDPEKSKGVVPKRPPRR